MPFHQTIALGRLGNDPELKYMPNGTAVCNFSLAVSEHWTDKATGEKREKATWYRVSVWGAQAESCNEYLGKGSQVMVVGTVEARGYTNNAGEAAASLELRATSVQFTGGKTSSEGNKVSSFHGPAPLDEDIPF